MRGPFEGLPSLNLSALTIPQETSEEEEARKTAYDSKCSMITDYLYVSGIKIASNLDQLRKYNIKYIMNCAGDAFPNYFEDNPEFKYEKFYLYDDNKEDVACLFYQALEFIENALNERAKEPNKFKKQNILVHCHRGSSRSCTLVISYIMFSRNFEYQKAFEFVKMHRGVCNPQIAFTAQLIEWKRRMKGLNKENILYQVVQHRPSQDNRLVAKIIFNFTSETLINDSEHVYILHTVDTIFIWIGSGVDINDSQSQFVSWFVKKLQKHEKGSKIVFTIHEIMDHPEKKMFWSILEQHQHPQECVPVLRRVTTI